MENNTYYKQVKLLVQLLPLVAEEPCFALKGGTAINLFIRELPRLSVDIDLVYLPMQGRNEALEGITSALTRISKRIQKALPKSKIIEVFRDMHDAMRLIVSHQGTQIKIELSPVLRGTVYEPILMSVCKKVEDEFGFAEVPVVSLEDIYAGKICAALDRQHPRDLFDVKILLENEGITENIRKALIVYIISHSRAIVELFNPIEKDISDLYDGEFKNMAFVSTSLNSLEESRKELIQIINESLLDNEKAFLLSFKNKVPDWGLLDLEGIKDLPAVRWKLENLHRMKADKHALAYNKLESHLLP
ncbi:MAG TPA: nucleotidyl transferase AbiEii/AbiGii toxin family protein [Leucothrix sp.]|nr:nucleotidyl transferase AbiEii/AbiGii toxin family protein [Leucothrix sp.]